MKRTKRLMILTGILALVCIATLVLSRYEEKQEQIKASDAVILEIPADEVQTLSWEYASGDGLAFHRGEDGWVYDADEAFPVSEEKITAILERYAAFGVSFLIEDVADYGQYGLDEPECTISIATAEESYDIRLGGLSLLDEQRYVDIGDGNVYLVSEDPMEDAASTLSAMILHDDIPDFGTATDITFAGAESYTITHTEDSADSYSASDIYFTQQDGVTVPLDTTSVRKYLNTVAALSLLDYVTYNATDEELAAYGLDDPELTVTIGYETDEETGACTLHISRNPEELAASEEAIAAGELGGEVTKYVRVGDSKIVYILDDTDYAILAAAGYNDLRHKELCWADLDSVTAIDVTLEGQTHSLTSELVEEDRVWSYGGTELDPDGLLGALEALSAGSFTDETPGGQVEIDLTIHLDNENFPTVRITLYRYDGSTCLASVDGNPTALVDRSASMDLVEAVQAIILN